MAQPGSIIPSGTECLIDQRAYNGHDTQSGYKQTKEQAGRMTLSILDLLVTARTGTPNTTKIIKPVTQTIPDK